MVAEDVAVTNDDLRGTDQQDREESLVHGMGDRVRENVLRLAAQLKANASKPEPSSTRQAAVSVRNPSETKS